MFTLCTILAGCRDSNPSGCDRPQPGVLPMSYTPFQIYLSLSVMSMDCRLGCLAGPLSILLIVSENANILFLMFVKMSSTLAFAKSESIFSDCICFCVVLSKVFLYVKFFYIIGQVNDILIWSNFFFWTYQTWLKKVLKSVIFIHLNHWERNLKWSIKYNKLY